MRKIKRIDVIYTDDRIETVAPEQVECEPDWTGEEDDDMFGFLDDTRECQERISDEDPFQTEEPMEEENPFLIYGGYDVHKDPDRLIMAAITEVFPDLYEVFQIVFDGPAGHEEKLIEFRNKALEKIRNRQRA